LIDWMLMDNLWWKSRLLPEYLIALSILVPPVAVAGGAAIAGGMAVCKRGLLARAWGSVGIAISAVYFAIAWCFLLYAIYDLVFPSGVSDPPALIFFPLLFYTCVGSVLTVMAAHRCWRRHATEPGPRPKMRWGKKPDAAPTRGYLDTIQNDAPDSGH